MRDALIGAGILLIIVLIVGGIGFAIYTVGLRRMVDVIGKPTPEEARVEVNKAENKAAVETKAEVKEIHDATFDELIDRGRDLSERGRAERLRK